MEKNTLLAIALSMLVLVGFYVAQGIFFPPQQVTPPPASPQAAPSAAPQAGPGDPVTSEVPIPDLLPPMEPGPTISEMPPADIAYQDSGPVSEQQVIIETELLTVVLTNAGGDIVSFRLKEHMDHDEIVEMIFAGDNQARAFSIAFGGLNSQPLSSLFHVEQESSHSVTFYRDFSVPNDANARFRLTKRYNFRPNEYMFELNVSLDAGFTMPGFNFGGNAYTLSFGPQIGPRFARLDGRQDFRHYFTFANGRRATARAGENNIINTSPQWAAISGKYFAMIAMPLLAHYDLNFSERAEPGLPAASRLSIMRPAMNSPRIEDTYRFYLGPKSQDVLNIYNTGSNGFGLVNAQLVEVANTRGILAPLERLLKWLLMFFYRLIPNYGVAIILLTLLVKIVFFPLTKKGSEATLRMQALAPKIKELQEKYKDNRQKLNLEMAEFYKKEGYNPLSGCLPMLLQLPIFFAMFSLFNNHFDLRGAMFIPGWIPDLSMPEAVWYFPDDVRLPLLGWSALRLLPFIYVGSQLLYGRVTRTPDQQNNPQMKMMLYVMPIAFFFILYNVPSGLLIYWIFSNILTMVQQLIINKYVAAKKKAQESIQGNASQRNESSVFLPEKKRNVIAPQKKKRRK